MKGQWVKRKIFTVKFKGRPSKDSSGINRWIVCASCYKTITDAKPEVKTQVIPSTVNREYYHRIEKGYTNKSVRVGEQEWMVDNLNVSTFRNGDTIPEAKTNKEWDAAEEAGKPAFCYYDNDPANGDVYGRLYTFEAALAASPPGANSQRRPGDR